MIRTESGFSARNPGFLDASFFCVLNKAGKSLLRIREMAFSSGKIPRPIHPAENTFQTATDCIACGYSAINTDAVEIRIFSRVSAADDFFGLSGQLQRIKRPAFRRQEARVFILHESKISAMKFIVKGQLLRLRFC